MRLFWYQWLELVGTLLLVASTSFQLFVLEPTLRKNDQEELSWKLTQTVQNTRAATANDSVLILQAMKRNNMDVSTELTRMENQRELAKKNIANELRFRSTKSRTDNLDELQKRYITLVVFLFGSLLIGVGRFGHLKREQI